MDYKEEITRAMSLLASDARTLFIGQAVACPGTYMTQTLSGVPPERLIELPVAEEMQMGMATGLALAGQVPVCIYPRFNFMLLAVNQIVNHLDKLPLISGYRPKVIIRVGIGTSRPLDPQAQHRGDFTDAFRAMCRTIEVVRLEDERYIVPAYERALKREDGCSTMLVEYGDRYLP